MEKQADQESNEDIGLEHLFSIMNSTYSQNNFSLCYTDETIEEQYIEYNF